jgi:hypothetical protein
MGTNYYVITNEFKDSLEKTQIFVNLIFEKLKNDNSLFLELRTATDKIFEIFGKDIVHLGKKSSGWTFLFNLNNRRFFSNKKELIDFIAKNKIINEYGQVISLENFLSIAFDSSVNLKKHDQEWNKFNGFEQYYYIIDEIEFVDTEFS